jgi:hypothetical protein
MRLLISPLLLLLVIVLIASYMSWARRNRASTGKQHARRVMPPELVRWIQAGILSRDQANAIVEFERGREARPGRVSLLTEALGYVGAVLATAGGAAALGQVWEDLSEAAHVSILAAAAIAAFAGGWLLRSQKEPAIGRLMSVLWTLSVGAVAGATGLLFGEVLEVSEQGMPLAIGGAAAIYAGALWFARRFVLQQVALFAMGLVAAIGAIEILPGDTPSWAYAMVAWSYGLAWTLLGWFKVMTPAWAAVPLGAIVGLQGPSIGADEYGWLFILALLSAGALMAASITERQLPLLAIGAIGAFVYLTWSVIKYFGDVLGVPTALALVGAVVLGIALLLGRSSRFGDGWHDGPTGHPA